MFYLISINYVKSSDSWVVADIEPGTILLFYFIWFSGNPPEEVTHQNFWALGLLDPDQMICCQCFYMKWNYLKAPYKEHSYKFNQDLHCCLVVSEEMLFKLTTYDVRWLITECFFFNFLWYILSEKKQKFAHKM